MGRMLTYLRAWVDLLFGYDFFVSYAHDDGYNYPRELTHELEQKGFKVFLDSREYVPGDDLQIATRRRIRMSKKLVVIARPVALQSQWVLKEVKTSLQSGRVPIVIDINATIENSGQGCAIKTLLEDKLHIRETLHKLDAAPSQETLSQLARSFSATRQETKRLRFVSAVAVFLFLLAGAAIWQYVTALRAATVATNALAVSQSRELVLFAEANIEKDPQLSLLLAIKAAELSLVSETERKDFIHSILHRAVLATPRELVAAGDYRIEAFEVSPKNQFIALGTQRSGVIILALADGSLLQRLPHNDWVDTIALNADGTLLASGARDNTVIIWDLKTGQQKKRLRFEHSPQSVHWRNGHQQLAIGLAIADSSVTKVYDLETSQELYEVPGMRAAWSPDGHLLATGGGDGAVHLFSNSGDLIASLKGHSRYVHKVVWRPDGKHFATASVDGYVFVWDAVQPKQMARLKNEFALSAAWSPTGHLLASGAGTKFVTVWETNAFNPVYQITHSTTITGREVSGSGIDGYVLDVAWGNDGKYFFASGRDGGILIFTADLFQAKTTADWLLVAKQQARRALSVDECKQYLLGINCKFDR